MLMAAFVQTIMTERDKGVEMILADRLDEIGSPLACKTANRLRRDKYAYTRTLWTIMEKFGDREDRQILKWFNRLVRKNKFKGYYLQQATRSVRMLMMRHAPTCCYGGEIVGRIFTDAVNKVKSERKT